MRIFTKEWWKEQLKFKNPKLIWNVWWWGYGISMMIFAATRIWFGDAEVAFWMVFSLAWMMFFLLAGERGDTYAETLRDSHEMSKRILDDWEKTNAHWVAMGEKWKAENEKLLKIISAYQK